MTNQKHLEVLKEGVPAWNEWRTQNPGIRPDLEADLTEADLRRGSLSEANRSWANLTWANLSGANLSTAGLGGADLSHADLAGADLTGADLSRARLAAANLRGADLTGADLAEAKFYSADLRRANLREANLRWADLTRADLTEADLRWADLTGADLTEADLRGADFTHSFMQTTWMLNVDLSGAKGLESVVHSGPSSIGIDAIHRSKANIPEIFLRAAGVPEPFIREMKALVNAMEPIQFYSCFISYSSKDREFADRLYADLQQKNVRCWFAPKDMKIGDKFRQRIDEAIHLYDKLLLVLTENSVKSAWVEKEVETAFEKERKQGRTVLFPIRLDDVVMEAEETWAADIRRTRHIGDFSAWKEHDKYKNVFDRLMRDLKAEDSPNGKAHRSGNPNG